MTALISCQNNNVHDEHRTKLNNLIVYNDSIMLDTATVVIKQFTKKNNLSLNLTNIRRVNDELQYVGERLSELKKDVLLTAPNDEDKFKLLKDINKEIEDVDFEKMMVRSKINLIEDKLMLIKLQSQ